MKLNIHGELQILFKNYFVISRDFEKKNFLFKIVYFLGNKNATCMRI